MITELAVERVEFTAATTGTGGASTTTFSTTSRRTGGGVGVLLPRRDRLPTSNVRNFMVA
jgi:hypothetical protein